MLNKLAAKQSKAAVMSLECQLAQVQIKRFLNGDNIPEDLLKDLEQHLLACEDCLAVAKGERAAVEAHMVATPSQAAELRQKVPATSFFDVFKQPKTLALSIALGAVLVLMSTVLRDPTKLLGAKAIADAPAAEKQEPTADETKDSAKPASEPPTVAQKPDKTKDSGHEAAPTEDHPAKDEGQRPEEPKASDTPKPRDDAAGHPTPPGPADAAIKAAREAAMNGSFAVSGKPTSTQTPIVEVTEGAARPAPPKAKATAQKHAGAPRRAAPRRTVRRTTPKAPAKKPASGGVKIYRY